MNNESWDCTLRALFTTLRRSDIRDVSNKSLKYFQYTTFHWMILRRFKWYYVKLWRNKLCIIFFSKPRDQIIKIFSIHVPLDDLTTDDSSDITWNYEEINCVSLFSKPRDFMNGPDLIAQSTGKPLWNPLTKVRSYTNHAWKWVLGYKLLWLYINVLLFNIFS